MLKILAESHLVAMDSFRQYKILSITITGNLCLLREVDLYHFIYQPLEKLLLGHVQTKNNLKLILKERLNRILHCWMVSIN